MFSFFSFLAVPSTFPAFPGWPEHTSKYIAKPVQQRMDSAINKSGTLNTCLQITTARSVQFSLFLLSFLRLFFYSSIWSILSVHKVEVVPVVMVPLLTTNVFPIFPFLNVIFIAFFKSVHRGILSTKVLYCNIMFASLYVQSRLAFKIYSVYILRENAIRLMGVTLLARWKDQECSRRETEEEKKTAPHHVLPLKTQYGKGKQMLRITS